MPLPRPLWIIFSCTVTLLASSTELRAQDRAEEARAAFQNGRAAAKRGDRLYQAGNTAEAQMAYERAAAYLVRAYELAPKAIVVYSLGEVYRMRGNTEWAIACYRRFVTQAESADSTSKAGKATRDRIPEARQRIEELAAAPANNSIPEETLAPLGVCLDRPDGPPTVGSSDSAAAASPIGTAPVTTNPVDTPSDGRAGERLGFWISAGVTVAAFAVSGIAHAQVSGSLKDQQLEAIRAYQDTLSQPLALEDACSDAESRRDGTVGTSRDLLDDVIAACDKGESRALLANITRGVGVLTAGAALYFLYRGFLRTTPEKKGASLQPSITDTTVGAHLTVRF